MRKYLPKDTEELTRWYGRYISPLALIAGFVADNLIFLQRVDLWTSNLLFFFYLTVAAAGIVLINLITTGRLQKPFFMKAAPLLPVVAQFAFGGLFSAYVSLYSRSAAFAASWVFVVLLAALLLGNERFTRAYARLPFQVGIFFTVLFSFLIFYVPVILGRIGPLIFLVSGGFALVIMAIFMRTLALLMPEHVRSHRPTIIKSIATIFAVFNLLYFSGAIPPLPLALKEAGVYHSIDKTADAYVLKAEPRSWYEAYLRYNTVFHRAPGESVFVYTAVFAPTKLSTTILHEWEQYNESAKTWVRSATFGYPITGGRDGGYRGYTLRENVPEGEWRVNVKTGEGLLIGRVAFSVVDVPTSVATVEEQH